jgi:geranylgeranyl diphosphate synthase type I
MQDVVMENKGYASEKQILQMFEGKTSRYTFEGPLHFGSILSGNGEGLLQDFSNYSLPLGKAFQIRDDILGVFGNEKKMGKPVGSDIIEGKQTLLLLKALQKGDTRQKNKIKKYLGKKDLNENELGEFRQIIEATGSLKYSQDLAKHFVDEALKVIERAKIKNDEARFFLEGIAKYIIEREA